MNEIAFQITLQVNCCSVVQSECSIHMVHEIRELSFSDFFKGQLLSYGLLLSGRPFLSRRPLLLGFNRKVKNRCYFKGAIIFWRPVSFWILWYVLLATLVETKDFVSWAHAFPRAQFKSWKAYWWLCSHHNIWFLKLLQFCIFQWQWLVIEPVLLGAFAIQVKIIIVLIDKLMHFMLHFSSMKIWSTP